MRPVSIATLARLPKETHATIREIVAHELKCEIEACARIVEDTYTLPMNAADRLAERIRARKAS